MQKIIKKRGGWSRTLARKKLNQQTLYSHFLWCKKEGRDTSWYVKEKREQI
jgi:hypothetical protein